MPTIARTGWLILACLGAAAAARAESFYRLESELKIPSPNAPNWDYLTYDATRDCVYISRREDGVLVYDAKAKRITGRIADTLGGNATTLAPEFDRGFVINLDGTATIFQPSTLKTLGRVKFGEDADNGFYDSATRQVLVTMGDHKALAFLDAQTGKLAGTLAIDSAKPEGAAADGRGNFFLALRDRDLVVRVDARARRVTAEWTLDGSELPNGVAYDPAARRIFVGCRGEKPVLAVIDADTGAIVARPPIGRGNDVVVFDPETKKIYAANGFDGTLVIIEQVDANTYRLAEAPTTRPYARTMALDPKTKKVYLATAEGTVDPGKKQRPEVTAFYPNRYFPNTFTLLTYARN